MSLTHFKIQNKHRGSFYKRIKMQALLPALALICIGLISVWSASLSIAEASFSKQFVGFCIALCVGVFLFHYDVYKCKNFARVLLIVDIILLLLPHIPGIGYSAKGLTGWVKLGPLQLQPSEPAKLVTILMLAAYAEKYQGNVSEFKDYIRLCVILIIPFMLILLQPDLGTGLVIFFLGAVMIVCSGAPLRWIFITISLLVLLVAGVVFCSVTPGLPHILKDYQITRLTVFMNPEANLAEGGYNLQQAKIAVGSGGFFGKGIGNASQAAQGFLPEAHTDFIFALFAEQFGFVGSILLLSLFAWLCIATLKMALELSSQFARLVLVGIVAMWVFQVFENIGMCLGLMPITGIPLPFMSYGSSSMLVQVSCLGVIQSLWRHRLQKLA